MARTKQNQFKIDATRPFYAVVGATDVAVEFARAAALDVQARFAKTDLEETLAELQAEAKTLPGKVESYVSDAVADLNEAVAELNESYAELAARGKDLVARIRRQQATQDAAAAADTTVAEARTAKTQTAKSVKATTGTAKTAARTTTASARKTAGTSRTSTKATSTSAKKAAVATGRATTAAASKVGD